MTTLWHVKGRMIKIIRGDNPCIFELDPTLMTRSSEILFNHLADGKIKPHIFERIPLSEAARAHELLENGTVQGKLILKP
jgi:NADPH:quinone reductase-like Zn-dependent oxidoreductase